MSNPKHWTEERAELLVERLVAAARTEQPPASSLTQALSGVGIAAAAATTATTAGAASSAGTSGVIATGASGAVGSGAALSAAAASGAGAAASKATAIGVSGVFKWILLATTLAGGAGLAVETIQRRAVPPAPVMTSLVAASSARQPSELARSSPSAVPPAPAVEAPDAPEPRRKSELLSAPLAPRAALPKEERPIDAERLAEEVRAVDQARLRLSSGRAAEALTLLDEYEKTFKNPGFIPEVLYLRMEALLELGQSAQAGSMAARLVRAYPNSPQTPRARQVLSEQNP